MKTSPYPSIQFAFAGRQIWPLVLAALHTQPKRLFLFHSSDSDESYYPAHRLEEFFRQNARIFPFECILCRVSHDNFGEIKDTLHQHAQSIHGSMSQIAVNITGGNKLMAIAAFDLAKACHAELLYLERGNQIVRFVPASDGAPFHISTNTIDPAIANDIDPLDILACQMGASEIQNKGELIRLSNSTPPSPEKITPENARKFLSIQNSSNKKPAIGDSLEFFAAAILLAHGVKTLRRGVELRPKKTKAPHSEIDLLFIWNGRLWLVDCKDKKPCEEYVRQFRDETRHLPIPDHAQDILSRIQNDLSRSHTQVMKEDLAAISEMGGVLGQVVCVRSAQLSSEIIQYANDHHIAVAYKNSLARDIAFILKNNRTRDEHLSSDKPLSQHRNGHHLDDLARAMDASF